MHDLGRHFERAILDATGATSLRVIGQIQSLWSGYGQIVRIALEAGSAPTVIAKHVRFPNAANHPRGWNSDASHRRKVTSYEVETNWYRDWSGRCEEGCRVPRFLAGEQVGDETLIVLEDLDAAGFPKRRSTVTVDEFTSCLRWLAEFHATFLGDDPDGLWPVGTYWHLATRADELEALDDLELKSAASEIDRRLSSARFQTLVHGDAKLANFCFPSAPGSGSVAAVDFQYVGGGCGMKDVAYFVGSCLDERSCEEREAEILDCYFEALERALERRGKGEQAEEVITEWRDLYHLAWVDFHRFLKGWSPGHWKINTYSERLVRKVLEALQPQR